MHLSFSCYSIAIGRLKQFHEYNTFYFVANALLVINWKIN